MNEYDALRAARGFNEGITAAINHYSKVDTGIIKEHPLPQNPYPRPNKPGENSDFYSWNRGWNEFHFMKKQIGSQMTF